MSRRKRPYSDPESAPPKRSWGQRVSPAGWLLIGIVVGLAMALYYAWVLNPVVYTDANPARLSTAYKQEYILLVSQNLADNGNWAQAEARLAQLNDPDLPQTIEALLNAQVKAQSNPQLIRNLATMAQQIGVEGQAVAIFAPTVPPDLLPTPTVVLVLQEDTAVTPTAPMTPTTSPHPTETAIPTKTPLPIRAATATAQPNYRLLDQTAICADDEDVTRIEVITVDAFLNQIAGVEILVSGQNGADYFFTGFKPDLGIGYGDFEMSPDISYTVVLADGSPEVSGLRVETCTSGFAGGWQLTFQNLIFGATATPGTDN